MAGPAPAPKDCPPGCGQRPPGPPRLCRPPLPPAGSGGGRAWEGDPEAERLRVGEGTRGAGGPRPQGFQRAWRPGAVSAAVTSAVAGSPKL